MQASWMQKEDMVQNSLFIIYNKPWKGIFSELTQTNGINSFAEIFFTCPYEIFLENIRLYSSTIRKTFECLCL